MLANFCSNLGVGVPSAPLFLLGLSSFSIFWPSWPPLGAIWARFGRVWGSILEGFWCRFWKVLGSTLEVFGDNLGLRLLLENLRLLLENLLFRSVLLASGSGWAGGVTRSAKNFAYSLDLIRVLCVSIKRLHHFSQTYQQKSLLKL